MDSRVGIDGNFSARHRTIPSHAASASAQRAHSFSHIVHPPVRRSARWIGPRSGASEGDPETGGDYGHISGKAQCSSISSIRIRSLPGSARPAPAIPAPCAFRGGHEALTVTVERDRDGCCVARRPAWHRRSPATHGRNPGLSLECVAESVLGGRAVLRRQAVGQGLPSSTLPGERCVTRSDIRARRAAAGASWPRAQPPAGRIFFLRV
jgi:hypothetical protein